jgi:hypothetical protein
MVSIEYIKKTFNTGSEASSIQSKAPDFDNFIKFTCQKKI